MKSVVRSSGMRSAIVVSDPYHLKRVRWTFRQVLKNPPVKWYFVSSDLPWDGKAVGELLVKGPWIVEDYYASGQA